MPLGWPGVVGGVVSGTGVKTVIGSEVGPSWLGFATASTASTAYVCVEPATRPVSLNVVPVVCPIGVVSPSR